MRPQRMRKERQSKQLKNRLPKLQRGQIKLRETQIAHGNTPNDLLPATAYSQHNYSWRKLIAITLNGGAN